MTIAARLPTWKELAAEQIEHGLLTRWSPEPHQIAPDGDWTYWLLLAGRMAGKSWAGAYWLNEHMSGPPCIPTVAGGHRAIIVAPTLGDALDSCVHSPGGLKAHNPAVRSVQAAGGTFVRWPNGASARVLGAHTPDDVERFRAAGNSCCIWGEELAAWRQLDGAWPQLELGLRLGPHPRMVLTTTPKPRARLKALIADPRTALTRATTREAARHVDPTRMAQLLAEYEGTRLGRQELDAEILEDVEGALWSSVMLDELRIEPPDVVPAREEFKRVVLAVDPSTGSGGGDECGIIIAGRMADDTAIVLEDRSLRASPEVWGKVVVQAALEWDVDRVLVEPNFGQGELFRLVMKSINAPVLPIKEKPVHRGKRLRAEPVVSLYEQFKIRHAPGLLALEEQMTTWVPDESPFSPDRIDALVAAIDELKLATASVVRIAPEPSRRILSGAPGRVRVGGAR